MTTDLAAHIAQTQLCDTHEHMRTEMEFVGEGPDILQHLFSSYIPADLVVAGADQAAVDTLLDGGNPDLAARFEPIRPAWEAVRFTGYGEAVRLMARELYDIDEITPAALEAAQDKHRALRRPGQRRRILEELAGLDHIQVDDFTWPAGRDDSGPDFFFYDISWASFCNGRPDLQALSVETGVQVIDLASLQMAMARIFERYAPTAIAVKAQHAYTRTLRWEPRPDQAAAKALSAYLLDPEDFSEADRLCLGDWCWARGVELAIAHDLPFKIHTGYYAGHSRMPVDYIKSGHLSPLLAAYPLARFVLMHIAYPYSQELLALTKHYPNVYTDMCWAWSIDPFSAADFLRRFIHAAPANKLFVFGGDTFWPGPALAYTRQCRTWLNRALQAEVDAGLLSEAEAIGLATRLMYDNQYACFRIEAKRAAIAGSATNP